MKNKVEILNRLYTKCNRIGEVVNIHEQMDSYKLLWQEEEEIREQIYYYIADCMGLSNEDQLTAEGYNILVVNGYILKSAEEKEEEIKQETAEQQPEHTQTKQRAIFDQEVFNKENNSKSAYELKQYTLEAENGTIITGGNFQNLETAIEKLKGTDFKGVFYLKRYCSSFNMKIELL